MREVVVLGIRSGTSVTTGILFNLGVFMGDEVFGPDEYNERGYWEDAHFVEVMNRIYLDMEGDKQNPPEELGKVNWDLIAMFRKYIKEHRKEPIWGFKAGGSTSLVPIIDALLDNPYYIVCDRDPIEVCSSLDRVRGHKNEPKKGWFYYAKQQMEMGKKLTEEKKRLIVRFDDVIDNTKQVIDEMCGFLKLSPTKKQIASAMAFVEPSLRHNKV